MQTVCALLLLALSARPRPVSSPAPTIDWPDFYARVAVQGVEYSDRMKELEGHRVRLRGYSVPLPAVPGGLLLSKETFAASEAEETEIPFDVVGVIWRTGIALPRIPTRPTVEGTLRLGNRALGDQIVSVTLEDAVPVFPSRAMIARPRR